MVQEVEAEARRHIKMFYSLTVMHIVFFLISGVGHFGLVTLSWMISSE